MSQETTGLKGPLHIGKPLSKSIKRIKGFLAEGHEVVIFTARGTDLDKDNPFRLKIENEIKDWCLLHIGQTLEVTNYKSHRIDLFYDDRAISLHPNSGETCRGLLTSWSIIFLVALWLSMPFIIMHSGAIASEFMLAFLVYTTVSFFRDLKEIYHDNYSE